MPRTAQLTCRLGPSAPTASKRSSTDAHMQFLPAAAAFSAAAYSAPELPTRYMPSLALPVVQRQAEIRPASCHMSGQHQGFMYMLHASAAPRFYVHMAAVSSAYTIDGSGVSVWRSLEGEQGFSAFGGQKGFSTLEVQKKSHHFKGKEPLGTPKLLHTEGSSLYILP